MPKEQTAEVNRTFKPGDFVFGKLKDYSPWPGKIDSNLGEKYRYKYKVFFYGTNQIAYLSHKDIYPYDEFKDRFLTNNKTLDFVKAISELEYAQKNESEEKMNISDKNSATPPFLCENENEIKSSNPSTTADKKRKEKTKKIRNGEKKHKKIASKKEPNNNTISSMKRKLYSDSSFKNISKIPKISKKVEFKDEDIIKQLDNEIKSSLQVSDPKVEKCIDLLNQLVSFKFDEKLILKYPEIIFTIKKVRKYKGSEEVRELADKIMNKLKEICRSLHSSDFNRIFQTTCVISKKPNPSEEPDLPKPEKQPIVPESLISEEKNRIRIDETIAQIIRESIVRLPDITMTTSNHESTTSPFGDKVVSQSKSQLDEIDAYSNVFSDEDIHKMLGI